MSCVIPCLYNSFSFTYENIFEDILVADISRKRVNAERRIAPEQAPLLVPEPTLLPETDSDSESASASETDSESVSETDTTSSDSDANTNVITPFVPENMSKYMYSLSAQGDSLLWCLYIMLYGVGKYEMVQNHYTESNQFKFELVESLRQNKAILKANKIKLTAIEDTLVNKPFIHLDTFHAVILCKNISVCVVQDRKYFEVVSGDNTPFIVEKIKGKFGLYLCAEKSRCDYLNYIRANYWLMENIASPIRPISAYKLQDLIDICNKLRLPVSNIIPGKFGSMGTEKRKTKPELYEQICRYV